MIESNMGQSPVVLESGRWEMALNMKGNKEAILRAVKPLGIVEGE